MPQGSRPCAFARYTGQEKGAEREAIRSNPPDILLTNYMMLELLLTRREDRELVRAAQGLRFLVFDELHTYRGRQGADVALLIRRCRQAFGGHDIICIGTSATMASEGLHGRAEAGSGQGRADALWRAVRRRAGHRRNAGARHAGARLHGRARARRRCATTITSHAAPPEDYDGFRRHPLASWIESTFGVRTEDGTGRLIRQAPRRLQGEALEQQSAAAELAELTADRP